MTKGLDDCLCTRNSPTTQCIRHVEQGHVTQVLLEGLVHHSVPQSIVGSTSPHQPLLLSLVLFTEVIVATPVLLSSLFPPVDATYTMQEGGPSPSQFLLLKKHFITKVYLINIIIHKEP